MEEYGSLTKIPFTISHLQSGHAATSLEIQCPDVSESRWPMNPLSPRKEENVHASGTFKRKKINLALAV